MLKGFFFSFILFFMLSFYVNAETLNVYMCISPSGNKDIVKFIKDNSNIDINYIHLTYEEIESRIKAEAPNFSVDMIIGGSISTAVLSKTNKWSIPYVSNTWSDISTIFKDTQGYFYNVGNNAFVLVGNTNRMKKQNIGFPSSWEGLTNSRYKDQIIMPSPISSGTGDMIRRTFLHLYGWDFLSALDKNINHYTRSGTAPANLVGLGEFAFGLTLDYQAKKLIDEGYPLSWTIPAEGTGYMGNYVLILKGTKKLKECEKVIDLFGTKEFNSLLSNMSFITPRVSYHPLYGKDKVKFVEVDLEKSIADKPKNNEIWKQKFR